MPRYEITSPEGKKFEITAPDGASQDQVLAYAQQNFKAPPEVSGLQKTNAALKTAFELTPAGFVGKYVQRGLEEAEPRIGGATTDLLAGISGQRSPLNPLAVPIPPEVSGAIGTAASMAPGMLVGGGMGRGATPLLQREGRSWMMSALKPSKAELKSGEGGRAAQTMLDEGKNVTEAGVAALRDKVGSLNDELQAALNSSPATVDKGAVASRLQDFIAKLETSSLNPQQRVKAVEKIYNEVLGNAMVGSQIPVALANKIKSGIYKELGDQKYARLRSGTPISDAEQAQASLARGLKEEVSAAVPEAAPANAKMSELIKASNIAENQVLAFSKQNPGGLSWLTHDLPSFIAMLATRHPASKSIIARALYNTETIAPATGAGVGGVIENSRQRR